MGLVRYVENSPEENSHAPARFFCVKLSVSRLTFSHIYNKCKSLFVCPEMKSPSLNEYLPNFTRMWRTFQTIMRKESLSSIRNGGDEEDETKLHYEWQSMLKN